MKLNRKDPRYPVIVAEILDVLAGCEMRLSDAARLLGIPTSHLVSFIEHDPKLWQCVSQMRAAANLKPLR